MERNRWETAIRCLEVALHANTADDEVIAAVNAFRRVAGGWSLRDVCGALAGVADGAAECTAAAARAERLERENRALRGKLADAENARIAAAERCDQARRGLGELREELRAARDDAAAAQRQFAEFRVAHAQVTDRLNRENAGLRRALEDSRRRITEPATRSVSPTFGSELGAALRRGDTRPIAAERVRPGGASAIARGGAGPAWIA